MRNWQNVLSVGHVKGLAVTFYHHAKTCKWEPAVLDRMDDCFRTQSLWRLEIQEPLTTILIAKFDRFFFHHNCKKFSARFVAFAGLRAKEDPI